MARRTGPDRWWRAAVGTMPVYLLAHLAKSQLWHGSMLLFGFFLTEACALDARAMGWVMAGSLFANASVDALLGRYWGRRGMDAGAARWRQAWGAPATCLCFVLFCATPLVAADLRLGWAVATLVGFRASYPFLDVPQNMLVALSTGSARARDALLVRRNIASGLAGLAVGAIGAPLLIHWRDAGVYLGWAGGISLFVCGAAGWLARADETACGAPDAGDDTGAGAVEPVLRFAPVLIALAAMISANAVFRTMEPYHAAFGGMGTPLLLWASTGGILGQPAWLLLRRRMATTTLLAAMAGLLMLVAIVLLTPSRGSAGGVALAGVGFGVAIGGLWFVLWSAMMARAARAGAGHYVGTFTGVSKLSQGAAMLLLGEVLARSAYRRTLADPLSSPSLLMTGAVVTIAATCIALAVVSRGAVASAGPGDGRSVRPG